MNQYIVSCGSTNCTALWATRYLEDSSAVLVVDELQRSVVEKPCCKTQSAMRNWSVCVPSSLLSPASELSEVHRILSFYCPTSGPSQESSIFHILDIHRVCSVGLTTSSANLCSLLREYHRIFFTGFEPSFQRGARIGNLRGPGAGAAAEDFAL